MNQLQFPRETTSTFASVLRRGYLLKCPYYPSSPRFKETCFYTVSFTGLQREFNDTVSSLDKYRHLVACVALYCHTMDCHPSFFKVSNQDFYSFFRPVSEHDMNETMTLTPLPVSNSYWNSPPFDDDQYDFRCYLYSTVPKEMWTPYMDVISIHNLPFTTSMLSLTTIPATPQELLDDEEP
jgi:hypothetical protein